MSQMNAFVLILDRLLDFKSFRICFTVGCRCQRQVGNYITMSEDGDVGDEIDGLMQPGSPGTAVDVPLHR